jgi:hypothetical protein
VEMPSRAKVTGLADPKVSEWAYTEPYQGHDNNVKPRVKGDRLGMKRSLVLVGALLYSGLIQAGTIVTFEVPSSTNVRDSLILDGVRFVAGTDFVGLDSGALVVIPPDHVAFTFGLPSDGTGVLWSPRHDVSISLVDDSPFTLDTIDVSPGYDGYANLTAYLRGSILWTEQISAPGYSTRVNLGEMTTLVVSGTHPLGGGFTIDNLGVTSVPEPGFSWPMVVSLIALCLASRRFCRLKRRLPV